MMAIYLKIGCMSKKKPLEISYLMPVCPIVTGSPEFENLNCKVRSQELKYLIIGGDLLLKSPNVHNWPNRWLIFTTRSFHIKEFNTVAALSSESISFFVNSMISAEVQVKFSTVRTLDATDATKLASILMPFQRKKFTTDKQTDFASRAGIDGTSIE